jgi:hypothetical protein
MTEQPVIHPQLGTGTLLKTYMGGFEWEVQFDSGRRFRLPAHEFTDESVADWQQQQAPAKPAPSFQPHEMVLETDQFRARQTLEALRLGIVPVQDVETLTIGLEAERVSLERALTRSRERGGEVTAVIGDYGFGKSHFIELAARRSLRENFLVATASLDLVEIPPGRPHDIYQALIQSLHYPDNDERGLAPLLKKALDTPGMVQSFVQQAPDADRCPLARALLAMEECSNQLAYDDMVLWISGQVKPTKEMRSCIKKPPHLYKTGEVARQYSYMLSAISVLATLVGYSGLSVLLDESEHYSLLRARQRDRADSFFKAMIYAAIPGTNNSCINPGEIPTHRNALYTVAFSDSPNLFFLFALTESESKLPVQDWLAPSQIVRLDDRFIERDIQLFFNMLLQYHAIAYGYDHHAYQEPYAPLVAVPGMLAQALGQHRINLREVIRVSVVIYDLLFLHTAYDAETLVEELRQGLKV